MMKPEPMSNQIEMQWNIDRYLLDDPTLDREAFEQQMLADDSLAEQVAASVANFQVLSQAASILSAPTLPPVRSRALSRPALWATLTAAAILLVAFTGWRFMKVSSDDQLARIADNWTAIENLSSSDSVDLALAVDASDASALEPTTTYSHSGDEATDADSREQSDWLVEAAREFYLANSEGAAG